MQQDTPQAPLAPPPAQAAPPQPPAPAPQLPPSAQPPHPEEPGSLYRPAQPAVFAANPADHGIGPQQPAPQAQTVGPDMLSWEASEYVHNAKGGLWIAGYIGIVVIMVGIAVWLSAWTFVLILLVMAVAMGFFAFRPPHVLHYTLTDSGVQIGEKMYYYQDYRAFGILEDGAFYTMTLIPAKRFSPALSVYFAEGEGEKIVDIVGSHLPMEQIEPDVIDKVMRRLRF